MTRFGLFFSLLLSVSAVMAQSSDAVLFSVDDMDITVSEFEYIYNKNNRDKADYSRSSIMEYLDLYTKFKLKVRRARELGLDTITALQTELAGYRSQLAKSYLNDKEVKEKLAREAYEHMKYDLHLSHILFKVEADATDEDAERAKNLALRAKERLDAGADFAVLAKGLSDDQNSAGDNGDLGYLTAIMPNGFYQMEVTAYSLKLNEVSDPVRSILGYHILKLMDRRPARGQIEASHILVRVKPDGSNEASAYQKINAILSNLEQGQEFEEMARSLSDDEPSGRRGGFIGKIGINMYDSEFENAAFSITEVGGYSKPVKTRLGWHIIKLLKRVKLEPFEKERRKIEARLAKDERIEIAREAMIENIKQESGFNFDKSVLEGITSQLNAEFLTFQWKVPVMHEKTLISFGNGKRISNMDFAKYLKANTRERMRVQKDTPPVSVALDLFEAFVSDKCLEYEEAQLDKKHPEFAALMREYDEGILLFEVTKMKVWDPASTDTAGLREFYEENKENYMWPERLEVIHYTINSSELNVISKAYKNATVFSTGQAVKKMNRKEPVLTFQSKMYTREESVEKGINWEAGWVSELSTDEGLSTFTKVARIVPPQPKQLNEARGYIIADYQDQLERDWIERLREGYSVRINQPVLKSLVRE